MKEGAYAERDKTAKSETVIPRTLPSVLYHFTSPQNVQSILRSGLKPSRDALGNPPAIWMNSEPVEVMGQTLLEVRTAGLNRKKFRVIKNRPTSPYVYLGTVPPGNVQALFSTQDESTLRRR